MADTFAALADPNRRQIVALLAEQDLTVNEIADQFDISRPAVSKHLKILRESGLVVEEKVGREHRQRFNGAALGPVSDWITRYESFWEQRLNTLKGLVEDKE